MSIASSIVSDIAGPISRSIVFGASYDADAQDYFTRAETLGGSFDQTAIDSAYTETAVKLAINSFILSLKDSGLWEKLTEIYLLGGVSFNGLMAKVKYGTVATLSNTNFAAGDLVAAGAGGGLKGNDSDKYLDTGLAPSATGSCGAYITESSLTDGGIIGNGSALTDLIGIFRVGGNAYRLYWGQNAYRSTTSTGTGFIAGSRRSTTEYEIYFNGSSEQAANNATSPTVHASSITLFQTFGSYSNARMSFAFWGDELSDAEHASLGLLVTTLMTAIGMNV